MICVLLVARLAGDALVVLCQLMLRAALSACTVVALGASELPAFFGGSEGEALLANAALTLTRPRMSGKAFVAACDVIWVTVEGLAHTRGHQLIARITLRALIICRPSLGVPAKAAGTTRPSKANELALFAPALRKQGLNLDLAQRRHLRLRRFGGCGHLVLIRLGGSFSSLAEDERERQKENQALH